MQRFGSAMTMFGVYVFVYGVFVIVNAFFPHLMDATPAFGVNLAVWYGFGLIVLAFLFALLYAAFGAAPPPSEAKEIHHDPLHSDGPTPRGDEKGGRA